MKPSSAAFFLAIAPLLLQPDHVHAAVTVNAPQTITRRVQVQPIRVRKTTGETAITFGSPENEVYIKTQVNRIMAQIGVRIDWLPIHEYTNDFAFDGSPANYTSTTRPESHLSTIFSAAPTPPKNSDPLTINLFFVEIVPGFTKLSEYHANGLAFGDSNGIAFQAGDFLPTFQNGRDVIAHVLAHEVCHNLGLDHTTSGNTTNNLMYEGQATSARLTSAQKTTIFTDNFWVDGYDLLRSLPPSTNYDQWDVANTVPGGPDDDPDGDGLDNIIEFMFGLNPHVHSQLPQPLSDSNGVTWTLPKQSGAVSDGIIYHVETSGTLGSWLAAGSDGGRSTILQNSSSSLVVRLAPGNSPSFMRMNVTIPATVRGTSITVFPPSATKPPLPAGPGDWMAVDPPGD